MFRSRIAGLVQSTKERLAAVSLDDVQDATSRGLNDGRARPAWIRDRTGRKGLSIVLRDGREPDQEMAARVPPSLLFADQRSRADCRSK